MSTMNDAIEQRKEVLMTIKNGDHPATEYSTR